MIGVLLCGGKSLRMGNDKGMITLQSTTWAQHVHTTLTTVCNATVISVNEEQYLNYKNIFSTNKIIIDKSDLLVHGPLKGLLSVHLQYPQEDLMVLACDMIDMNAEILKALLKNHEDSVYTDVSVYKNDDRVEPLCSIYSSKALQKIITLLKANQLTKHSMLFALEQLNTNYIQLKEEWKPAFKNYNTPNDLHTT